MPATNGFAPAAVFWFARLPQTGDVVVDGHAVFRQGQAVKPDRGQIGRRPGIDAIAENAKVATTCVRIVPGGKRLDHISVIKKEIRPHRHRVVKKVIRRDAGERIESVPAVMPDDAARPGR